VAAGSSNSGLTVTYNNPCSLTSTPASSKGIPYWVWIIVGVVGGIIIILILLFAIPKSRNAILRKDVDDEGGYDMPNRARGGSSGTAKPGPRPTSGSQSERKAIPNPPFNVTAIADYMAVDTSQISVTKGVVYTVQRVDEGQHWFQAKGANGKLGWFPASYSRIEN